MPSRSTANGSVTESTASTLAMVATDAEIWALPPAPEVRESVCLRLRRPSSGTEWLRLLLSSVWQLDKATLDGKPVVIERHGSVAFVAIDEDPSASEALLELEMQGSLSKSEGEDRQVVTADSLFLVQQTETKATIIGETIRRSLRKKKGERGK